MESDVSSAVPLTIQTRIVRTRSTPRSTGRGSKRAQECTTFLAGHSRKIDRDSSPLIIASRSADIDVCLFSVLKLSKF